MKVCSECEGPVFSRGLCQKHYANMKEFTIPEEELSNAPLSYVSDHYLKPLLDTHAS